MKSWQVTEPNKLELIESESAKLGADSVKIKMTKLSIALTDELVYKGKISGIKYPITLGRNGVGIVSEVGENVKNFVRGNRVVIDPYTACNECVHCKDIKDGNCENLLTFGVNDSGIMCDIVNLRQIDIRKLPDQVSDNDALFVEQISLAIRAISDLDLRKGDHVVIVGASVVGLIAAQVAIYYQHVPIVVDSREDRLALAEQSGVYYTVNTALVDPFKKIQMLTGGRMADAVIYDSNTTIKLQRSLDYVVKNGKLIILGFAKVYNDLNVNLNLAFENQVKISCINSGIKNLPSAINMLANKSVTVANFISQETDFANFKVMLDEIVASPEMFIKVVINV